MQFSRREFLMGCSAAIAAMAGGRIGQMTFANTASAASGEILVMVFLRGGCDSLSLLSPFDDARYRLVRGRLALPTSGDNAAIPIDPQNPTFTSSLGLHAKAAPLKELYDSGALAFVHATGLQDDTRSHFDAMDYIERGTPGNKSTGTGWITRHLEVAGLGNGLLPVLSAGATAPTSLLSSADTVAMQSARDFNLFARSRYNNPNNRTMFDALRSMYGGEGATPFHSVGGRAIETIDALGEARNTDYVPTTEYPRGSFGESLKTVAQTIKLGIGMQVATVDLGGWDTHESQGFDGTGYFANKVDELSRGLHAFYNDLPEHWGRMTVVVMSEFGRRLGVNSSGGTDHGHGGMMMLLGGSVNGRRVFGNWPGLEKENLDQQQDLAITTDFRSVLGEVLAKRLGNVQLGHIFPGLTAEEFAPLSVVNGTAPGPINFGALVNRNAAKPDAELTLRTYLPLVNGC